MTTTTLHIAASGSKLVRLFALPFRVRRHNHLDARYLSDHFKRDIGLLDGHVTPGTIR